jgi:HD-like signal output (HDOD) protein
MSSLIEALPTRAIQPPERIRERLLSRGDDLCVLPAVANQALELARDPDCSIEAFSKLVEQDLKLASEILAIANSALYAPPSPISNLKNAVGRLGFRQCKNLILTSSLNSLMRKITLEQQWIRDVLWRHNLATAIHCHKLNEQLKLGFQGEEFTAGLIHDLGRTLLAVAIPEQFSEIDPLDFVEGEGTLIHEQAVAGTDHCQVGAWFVHRSGLPISLYDVVLQHHEPESATRLTALVIAADHMTNHLQCYLQPEQYAAANNPGLHRLEQIGVRNAVQSVESVAVTMLEDAAEELVELTRAMG